MQKLIYGVFAFLLLLILVGFALPRTHQFEVSIEIDAPPATVYALVSDFRRHAHWSPWADTDPNARILYSGALRGEGAIMTWDGAIIGSGSQIITTAKPYERIDITMNPGDEGQASSWFVLQQGVGTSLLTRGFEVDYGMNIVGRYFASMLGSVVARDYYLGLERLKELAESLPSADFGSLDIEHIVVEAQDIAYLSTSARPEPGATADALRDAYFEILRFIDAQGLSDAGAPLSITRGFKGADLAFDAAIPVRGLSEETPRAEPLVRIGETYAGPVIRVKHVGSYRTLSETHRRISAYLAAFGIERNGAAWESYVSDPGNTPEEQLLTYVYYPISVN